MTLRRKECQHGNRCDVTTLGEAVYCLIHHSDLDAKDIADRVGVRHGYLLDAANPDRGDTQLQARLLIPLTLATGNDVVLEYIARRAGGCYFRLPTDAGGDVDLVAETSDTLRMFGDVFSRLGQAAMRDLAPTDAERLIKGFDVLIQAVSRLRSHIERKALPVSHVETRRARARGERHG